MICSACKSEFECGVEEQACWCFDLPNVLQISEQKSCLCKSCLLKEIKQKVDHYVQAHKEGKLQLDPVKIKQWNAKLIEGIDYTIEQGKWVFSAWYLLKQGSCCDNQCRHCPYTKRT